MANHGIDREVQMVVCGYTLSIDKKVCFGSTRHYYIMRSVTGKVQRLPKSLSYIELLTAWAMFRQSVIDFETADAA